MKFTIKKDLLLEALKKVSKAISTKNLIPVLAGVKFELKKKKLTLTASDNDITIQTSIESVNEEDFVVENEGSIIIQGKYILDIVRKLPDKYINIEVIDELKILIYTENSEFNLNGISESEYPNIGLEESKKKVNIKAGVFKSIVNQTAFASSNEESKPVLTGINLNIVEFSKILGDDEDVVELHIFNNKILFKTGNLKFESRLINGTYPNTSNLLPDDSFLIINTNLGDFYDVIDRVSILTSDKEKNIVTLETNDNILILRSSSAEIGRVEEKMKISKNNNENIKISFSAKYMMEALKSFSTETVDIHFVGEIKPILIKSKEDETLTQLVLPIRTY